MRAARDLSQQVRLGSWGRSSPHASSRPPRHLQITATLDPRPHSIRRVFRHEGKPKTQQVHCWERCHGPRGMTSLPTFSTRLMQSSTLQTRQNFLRNGSYWQNPPYQQPPRNPCGVSRYRLRRPCRIRPSLQVLSSLPLPHLRSEGRLPCSTTTKRMLHIRARHDLKQSCQHGTLQRSTGNVLSCQQKGCCRWSVSCFSE